MAQHQDSIEDKIERNKQKIASLTEQLRKSLSSNENRIQGLEVKIESLEKEIQDLKDKNEMLVKELQAMKDDNKEMKDDNKVLKERIELLEKESKDQKARKQYEDSVLVIGGIASTTQRNMCKYVLGEHFKSWHHKFKDIENYIEQDLEHQNDQEAAGQRLEELKKNIPWNHRLMLSLKNLNCTRIGIAHPELSSEKIQQATELLKEKGELDEEMVENISKLKKQWEVSEALLGTSSRSAEVQDQSDPMSLSTKVQNKGASTSKAAENRCIPRKVFPTYLLNGN